MKSIKKTSPGQVEQVSGWSFFEHNAGGFPLFVSTIPTLLFIDGLGSNTDTVEKPTHYGDNEMWVDNKIIGVNLRDAGEVRCNLEIDSKTGAPEFIEYVLDIGGQSTITSPIWSDTIILNKTPPYKKGFILPIFTKQFFIDNGCQIFLFTDAGSVTITNRDIFIKIDHKGGLKNI